MSEDPKAAPPAAVGVRVMRAQQPPRWAAAAEALVSLCCVALIGFVVVNGFGAYFCLDPAGCPEPHSTPVVAYRVAAGLLVNSVMTAAASDWLKRTSSTTPDGHSETNSSNET